MRKLKISKSLTLLTLALFPIHNLAFSQEPAQETTTIQKTATTQAAVDDLLQHMLIMTSAQAQNANARIGNEATPLSSAIQKPIEALSFLQNNVHVRKINVYSFTGLDLEVIGRVLVNERNKSERVGTVLLAEKNYATGKPGVFVPRQPFAYLNLNQIDSLTAVLNDIVKESYQSQQYVNEINYVAEGGLMVQYYSSLQKIFFKNVAPSDRISNFDYSASKISSYGYHTIEVKVQKDMPQIADALKRAKTEVENYLKQH